MTPSEKSHNIVTTSILQSSQPLTNLCDKTLNLHVPFDETPTTSTAVNAKNMHRVLYGSANSSNYTRCNGLGLLSEVKSSSEQMIFQNYKFDTLDVNKLPEQDNKYAIARKLVCDMVNNISCEEQYILCFKKLVAFEHGSREGHILSEEELEKEFAFNFKQTSVSKSATGKGRSKRSEPTTLKTNGECQMTLKQDKTNIFFQEGDQYSIECDLLNRMSIRGEILSRLLLYCERGETYDTLIDQIIDLEEDFVVQSD